MQESTPIKQSIFRPFSIRGNAERDLPNEVVTQIGRAVGAYFEAGNLPTTLVVGRDVRQSSPRISRALISGLVDAGCAVIDIGLVPTPTLNFAVDHFGAQGGAMVTASHNPPPDNGLKLRADQTLTGEALQEIYRLAQAGALPRGKGEVITMDALIPYLIALQERVEPGRALKIVVDGGNGANGPIVAAFLRQQGHTVFELFAKADGSFPNRNPDPTAENALKAAAQLTLEQGAHFGLAFDGDGDRIALIDNKGRVHYGDIILMLLARQEARRGAPPKVVFDVSCTKALSDDIIAHGGQPFQTIVGYAFVHQKMQEVGALLGGESAGHIFCLDSQFRFDDAILASVKLLNYFSGQAQPVSQLIADLPRYHTSPNYRIACPDALKAQVIAAITQHYQATHQVDVTDGAKIMFSRGWALVRQSNTQPALSFRAEGETPAEMERIKNDVLAVIDEQLAINSE